ncbi:PREDICTED: tumor necrosis factor receptor superfamily member 13C [Tauraco erythrolophus]|uniref:tumor necrosis factor receptor superfamily member 13C n=1 Tax=Tauraco erythrolophus TaxID=121530 RepID=UPI000523DEB2|nr:PREDICTED: tumor necrosis factor receptor superfamily member 13C [Tauraco erythrolophus]
MSSSGKAATAFSCLSSQCFDLLTRSCVKCSDLFKDNTTEPAHAAPTSTLTPTLPSMELPSTFLIIGVPAIVGFILALAIWGFLACKVGKQKRKRKVADEEAEANVDAAGPLPGLGYQDPATPEGEVALALAPAPCLKLNGGLTMPGPPRKAGAKRRPCCQGDADGDIVLLSTVYPRHEECNHGFPLPATELGATALVTTKTTQNCTGEERA